MDTFSHLKSPSTCKKCGILFLALNRELKRGKAKFCGIACSNSTKRQTKEGWRARRIIARKADRTKDRAREAVARALKSGKLKKSNCSLCGEVEVNAHHEDYSQPLMVAWLCHPCHMKLHKYKRSLEK